MLAGALVVADHPVIAERAGRQAGKVARHFRSSVNPEKVGYRIVGYWFPLLPGAAAYLRLRLAGKV